jgi:hypothetical protein
MSTCLYFSNVRSGCPSSPVQLVLLKDHHFPPLVWQPAVITEVSCGEDSCVRVVKVTTSSGTAQTYTQVIHIRQPVICSWLVHFLY